MKPIETDKPKQPSEKLAAFKSYEDFLAYVGRRFDLRPGEHEALYNVLVKLQNVGADPLETMEACKSEMAPNDCLDMLRFMIYIENLDISELKDLT